ncbi:MAG: peptidoglycan DD-metalloendopeptidase family protein [Myxococcota bacterium]|nr:peptidoglycan DD-metalloendopeptidase family protein [Myxococcota bacterium]
MSNPLKGHYHPVIKLPDDYEVYDFSKGYDPERTLRCEYGIGKYGEKRPNMYRGELFEKERRDIHIGIDIAAPVGTPVYSFAPGKVFLYGNNDNPFDYGPTIITEHILNGTVIYALHGHLSLESLEHIQSIHSFSKGTILGFVGSKIVNGGWNPHLHFQLSKQKPLSYDMPGVVHESQLSNALETYPDPRLVLGMLYE